MTGQLSGLGGTTAPARIRQLSVSIGGRRRHRHQLRLQRTRQPSGVIWNDADGDGVQDPEEIGLGGVTVELQDGCTPGVDCPITTTAPDGSYSFVGLRPDLYTVEVTDTAGALTGYTQTGDPDEPGTCSVCDSLSTTVVNLTTGDQSLDFGYRNGSLDDISGRIFDDEDADGVEDPGESGLAGVTVALLDDAGNVLATTTTDANGDYVFPDLPSGSYSVRVTDEAGFLDGYRLTSGLDELSPAGDTTSTSATRRAASALHAATGHGGDRRSPVARCRWRWAGRTQRGRSGGRHGRAVGGHRRRRRAQPGQRHPDRQHRDRRQRRLRLRRLCRRATTSSTSTSRPCR